MPFILIVIGIVLIVYNYRAIKKKTIQFEIKDKDKSFATVFKDNKENLNDYQMELGILRKNIGESLTELQLEILDIKKQLNMVKAEESLYENKSKIKNTTENNYALENEGINKNSNTEDEDNGIISEINFKTKITQSNKTEIIDNLIKKGLTDDEICHELSISKGEVLLVRELFKQ